MCSDPNQRARLRAEGGYNLLELLISMSLATIIFMAMVTLFVSQSKVMDKQNEAIAMNREASFGLDHLRRDLSTLGSHATPNSDVDPLVCPKPGVTLRALTLGVDGYVSDAGLNPNVNPLSLTLFGSLDVKQRFRTESIDGSKVILADDGKLPATEEAFQAIFAQDRWLRLSGPDGKMMYFPIVSASQSGRTITVQGVIPRMEAGQVCGYQGFGDGMWVDVQGFVRYRVIEDKRPGAPVGKGGKGEKSLLVRERLAVDGTTLVSQLVLVDNAVDLQVYDAVLDNDPNSDVQKLKAYPLADDLVQKNGDGPLGSTLAARPEALRFLTVKLSVRTEWADKDLVHKARDVAWQPLETWLLADDGRGANGVVSVASRIALPTLVSRNL